MCQSLLYHGFGVREGHDYVRTEYAGGAIKFHLRASEDRFECPECRSREVIRQGKRFREIRAVPIGLKPSILVTEAPRCRCKQCGHLFELGPLFARPYAHCTRQLERFVFDLHGVMTVSDLAVITGLGWDTVKSIVAMGLEKKYGKLRFGHLKHLAIDEFYTGKKGKYLTFVMDLETGAIVWVARGRGENALVKFWRALRLSKAKVEAVATDMSAAYGASVVKNVPDALLVFDRFHLVQLVNRKLDELRRQMVREVEATLKKTVKGVRYLLLMNRDRLSEKQLPKLEEALQHNEALNKGYLLKESLRELWNQANETSARSYFLEWRQQAIDSGVTILSKLGQTMKGYLTGILNWWPHKIGTAQLEGTNRKIRTLQSQHYGFRDERFFFLKLLSLHEAKYKLIG